MHSPFCIGFVAFPRRRSRRWIGFFVVLGVLAVAAMVIPVVYNLSIQLRPEQVAEARRHWQDRAPDDYDLAYLVKSTNGGQEEESQYLVKVRGGRIILVVNDGQMLFVDPALAVVAGAGMLALSFENPERYGVASLLKEVERGLDRDVKTGKRLYSAKAQFDANDGHPYHYVRRRLGTKEQVEWNVKLTRVPASPQR